MQMDIICNNYFHFANKKNRELLLKIYLKLNFLQITKLKAGYLCSRIVSAIIFYDIL